MGAPQSLNFLEIIMGSGLVVQMVLMILVFFSLTSWTIIFMKYRMIKRAYHESVEFNETFWKSRNLAEAYAMAKRLNHSPVARVFKVGYLEIKKISQGAVTDKKDVGDSGLSIDDSGMDAITRSLRRASTSEITRLNQFVAFLATAGNTAPFIGLFGTVWGIMNSFHNIGITGSASLAAVAPGISEALIATAVGLGVAIPAVIGFNFFNQKIRVINSEMENFSADFLNIIEHDIMRRRK